MTNKRDIAIEIRHVKKTFFETFGPRSFKDAFVSLGQRLVGKYEETPEKSNYTALKDINISIKKGEFFGIVGRNGGGKSTLLKIIAGVYYPTEGEIIVNGKLTPFIELGVGFNPELSGKDNVYLNGALLGFTRKQMDKMYDDIVEFAELENFMDMKLKNYSSGMQVRLAFSVAIRAKTEILVVDEVLAVGDAAFQRKCYDYFMNLKKNKQTVVLVTHDMGAIRQYCDRAALIEQGKVRLIGDADDVAQAYQKMFADEEKKHHAKAVQNGEDRWGNGKMLARKPHVKVASDNIRITAVYDVKESVDTAILGFSVYGPTGQNILEQNTKNTRDKIQSLEPGDTVLCDWVFPNVLATGEYTVSVACCDESTTQFYDWLNDAAAFNVQKKYLTSGIVNPDVRCLKLDSKKGK